MHVLYDTNSLVRIFARRGEMIVFRELLLKKQVTHITSEFILDEVEAVLALRMGLTKQKAKAATRALARLSEVVSPDTVKRLSRDSDDDNVIAAAVEGGADYLVTADNDLLVLKKYKNTKIITPADFKKIMS